MNKLYKFLFAAVLLTSTINQQICAQQTLEDACAEYGVDDKFILQVMLANEVIDAQTPAQTAPQASKQPAQQNNASPSIAQQKKVLYQVLHSPAANINLNSKIKPFVPIVDGIIHVCSEVADKNPNKKNLADCIVDILTSKNAIFSTTSTGPKHNWDSLARSLAHVVLTGEFPDRNTIKVTIEKFIQNPEFFLITINTVTASSILNQGPQPAHTNFVKTLENTPNFSISADQEDMKKIMPQAEFIELTQEMQNLSPLSPDELQKIHQEVAELTTKNTDQTITINETKRLKILQIIIEDEIKKPKKLADLTKALEEKIKRISIMGIQGVSTGACAVGNCSKEIQLLVHSDLLIDRIQLHNQKNKASSSPTS